MILTPADVRALLELLPADAYLMLPNEIPIERPGESVGRIYASMSGHPKYEEY